MSEPEVRSSTQDPAPGTGGQTPRAHDTEALGGVLAGALRVVASFTLLSRLTGLVRDVLTAKVLGDTAAGSAFGLAFAIPNLFRRLFGEGALSAAFLPEYTTLHRDDPARAPQLASLVLFVLTLVTGGITLLLEIGLLLTLLMGVTTPERTLTLQLIMLMLPMMPMVCITAILGGMLQAHGRFGPPAAAPILLNLLMIGGAIVPLVSPGVSREGAAYLLGFLAVAASGAQIVWSLRALRGLVRWTRLWSDAAASARRVLGRFVPVVLGLSTLQLNTLLDSLIATWPILIGPTMFGRPVPLDEASNAILSYTSRLYQFPLGVFGIAVATAVFPLLSRTSTDALAFTDVLRRGVRLSLFIGIPASVGLVLVRDDLVRTMFPGFSAAGLERSALVVACYAPAVWAYSLNHVLTRAFYARGDTRTPMTIAVAMVLANVAMNFTLIWPLREAGLALSTGISAMTQAIIILWIAQRKLGVVILDREMVAALARLALVAALMGLCVWVAMRVASGSGQAGWTAHFLRLCAATVVGAGSYLLLAVLLRLREVRWLLQRAPKGAPGESMLVE